MPAPRHILGISAYYHDAAAALVVDGRISAAAQEERFTRKKNDPDFPAQAVRFCLQHAGLDAAQLDAVVFYDKPVLKFARLLETYLAVAPGGWRTFPATLTNWLGGKLDLRKTIRAELPGLRTDCPILFTEHHQAHAASAFYPSPFDEAAILTIDGVGEWATTTIGHGRGREIKLLQELRFPHSLGLVYSTFTDYCGFRINSGEYKLMGLAPYGEPKYAEAIRQELLDIKADGSFWLNLDYFNFLRGTTMTNERFHRLFGGPPRGPEEKIEQRHMDVARSIQLVTEEIMLLLARQARKVTGLKQLCLAGGVALNCVANGRILREIIFDELWIQPAAGDAGGALGAALAAWNASAPATEVAQVSQPAVPPISKSADLPNTGDAIGACDPRVKKPAIQQTGKSALQVCTPAQPLETPGQGTRPTGEPVGPVPSPGELGLDAGMVSTSPGKASAAGYRPAPRGDAMQSALLGPGFSDDEIETVLRSHQAVFQKLATPALLDFTVDLLKAEKVTGWFQGRMEFGPRALGNRSILGDARSAKMQSVMNLKVKFRESFRPFAPIVRRERVADYFELDAASPYMLLVAPVKKELCHEVPPSVTGFERLKEARSTLPAITHVDYSARIQTVEKAGNPLLYDLLLRFEQATGCGVLVNTSFNVRGEPVVCTPDDAYRCFMNTEMDYLIMGSFIIERTAQPRQEVARRLAPQAD